MRVWTPMMLAGALACAVPAAAHEDESVYDRIHISADAEEQVPNDTLIAVLYVQREGRRQREVADAVNRVMRAALDAAAKVEAVRARTLSYHTSPVYREKVIAGWRGRQQLHLESREAARLTELVGELQEHMAVQSMGYTVSAEARAAAERRLIVQALRAYRERASLIATQLGRTGYRIVRLNVDTGGAVPPPMPMHMQAMRAGAAEVAPPAVEAGEQTLRVTVSGSIELDPVQ